MGDFPGLATAVWYLRIFRPFTYSPRHHAPTLQTPNPNPNSNSNNPNPSKPNNHFCTTLRGFIISTLKSAH